MTLTYVTMTLCYSAIVYCRVNVAEIDTDQLEFLANLQRLSLEENVLSCGTLDAMCDFQASHEHIIITW